MAIDGNTAADILSFSTAAGHIALDYSDAVKKRDQETDDDGIPHPLDVDNLDVDANIMNGTASFMAVMNDIGLLQELIVDPALSSGTVGIAGIPGNIISVHNDLIDLQNQVSNGSNYDIGASEIILAGDVTSFEASLACILFPEIVLPLTLAAVALNISGSLMKRAASHQPGDLNDPNSPPAHHNPGTQSPAGGIPANPPLPIDPLVVDLAGAGISLTALEGSAAHFDYAGSGFAEQTGWIKDGEGLLVTEPQDGVSVTAANLLGAQTGNGFEELAQFDENGDGVIDASDPGYFNLRVWVDSNGDGSSSGGELFGLNELGILSISLSQISDGTSSSGNTIVSHSTFQVKNSSTGVIENHNISEVNFQVNSQLTISTNGSSVIYSGEAIELPDLVGYGRIPDLGSAITADPNLAQTVRNLVSEASTMSASSFNVAFQKMVMQWVGCEGIDPNSAGGFVDARQLAVIYAYYGIDPSTNTTYQVNPNWHNSGLTWLPLYDKIIASFETRFVSQIAYALANSGASTSDIANSPFAAFSVLNWDEDSDQFRGSIQQVFRSAVAFAPTDTIAAADYWEKVVPILSYLGLDLPEGGMGESPTQQLLTYAVVAQLPQYALSQLSDMLVGHDVMITSAMEDSFSLNTRDNLVIIDSTTVSIDLGASDVFVVSPNVQEIRWSQTVFQSTLVLSNFSSASAQTYLMDVETGALVITSPEGNSLRIDGFFNSDGSSNVGQVWFADGSSYTGFGLLTVAEEQGALGDSASLAAGGYLGGTSNDDVLVASSDTYQTQAKWLGEFISPTLISTPYDSTSTPPVRTDDIAPISAIGYSDGDLVAESDTGYLIVNGGKGNDVFVPGTGDPSAQGVKLNELIYNLGDGEDAVVTPARIYGDNLEMDNSGYLIGGNSLQFGEGITAADISIKIAGADAAAINGRYAIDVGADAYSMVVSIAQAGSITFTGGLGAFKANGAGGGTGSLLQINFADGSSLSEAQIDAMYVQSEEDAGLQSIYAGDQGQTLIGSKDGQTLIGGDGDDILIAGPGDEILAGYGGRNTYSVDAMAGNTTIVNNRDVSIYANSDTTEMFDVLTLGDGIGPQDLSVTVDYAGSGEFDGQIFRMEDIVLTVRSTGQTIRLVGQNAESGTFVLGADDNGAAVGQINFADGTVWSALDIINAVEYSAAYDAAQSIAPGYEVKAGTIGPDPDYWYHSDIGLDDTLAATQSDTFLAGGDGNDTYLVNSGDGSTVIDDGAGSRLASELGYYPSYSTDVNVLKLGDGISKADVSVSQGLDGASVVLTFTATGQTITLEGQLTQLEGSIIQSVQFADGTEWSSSELADMSIASAEASQAVTIYGSSYATTDVLLAPVGDATLVGRGSSTTYVIPAGSYTYTIAPEIFDRDDLQDYTQYEVIELSEGIDPASVTVSASEDGVDAILTVSDTGETIIIKGGLEPPSYEIPRQDIPEFGTQQFSVVFANGVTWSQSDLASYIYTPYDPDVLRGDGWGDVLDTRGIQHYIISSVGGDWWNTGDTVIYNLGYGSLTIDEFEKSPAYRMNQINFGEGIGIQDISASISADGSLILRINQDDIITITGGANLADPTNGSYGVDFLNFTDGTSVDIRSWLTPDNLQLDASSIAAQPLVGDGDAQVFTPNGFVQSISGGGGADRIYYSKGQGSLSINEIDESDRRNAVLEIDADISLQDISYSVGQNGDVSLDLGGGDVITLIGQLISTDGVGHGVSQIDLVNSEGVDVFTSTDIRNLFSPTILYGDGSGDVLDTHGLKHEIVSSTGGGDYNTSGADTIVYNQGYGTLYIDETVTYPSYGSTAISFGAGITPESISAVSEANGDLQLNVGDGGDVITIKGGLNLVTPANGAYGVDSLDFIDGTSLYLYDWLHSPDASVDFSALSGVTLVGDEGAQTFQPSGLVHAIVGGGGADSFFYWQGEGALQIDETDIGSPPSSTLFVYSNLSSDAVSLDESGNDLMIDLGAADVVTLVDQLSSDAGISHGVSEINLMQVDSEGALVSGKFLYSDGSYQRVEWNVVDQDYYERDSAYDNAGDILGRVDHLNDGSSFTELNSSGSVLSVVGGEETLLNGDSVFDLGSDAWGEIDLSAAPNSTLAIGVGNWGKSVTGFATSGPGADVLSFSADVFSDWAHLLGATQQVGDDLQITLDDWDVLTLKNVSMSSFTAANARFG